MLQEISTRSGFCLNEVAHPKAEQDFFFMHGSAYMQLFNIGIEM